MASAVLAMSVHPVIHDDVVDDHVFNPSALDLSGLAQTIEQLCRGGNRNASVRIANTYLDLDVVGEIQDRSGMSSCIETLGAGMMGRAGVPGKSRNGVIKVADEWSRYLDKDMEGQQLAPSVFFIMVKASTSLTVGDWLHQALALFDSYRFPSGMIEAFGVKASQIPSPGRLPDEVADKLESMFCLPFQHKARLEIVCRKG